MDRTYRALGCAAGILILLQGCTTQPRRGERNPSRPTGAGAPVNPELGTAAHTRSGQEYQQIYALFTQGQYDQALQRLSSFERRYPRSAELAQARNLHGLCLLMTKRYAQSIPWFRSSIQAQARAAGGDAAGSPFAQYVLYNLATAQLEAGQVDESMQTLGQIRLEMLDRDNQIKTRHLKSRVLLKRGLAIDSARESLDLSRQLSDLQIKEAGSPFVVQLQQALQGITNTQALEKLFKDYEDSRFADLVLFRLGSREVSEGNVGSAEVHLRTLMARFPDSVYYAQSNDLLSSMQSQAHAEPNTVGVLLPMKGKFAAFGQRSLQSIELGFNIFNSNDPDSKVTLVIEDSGDDGDSAIKALDRLVYKDHVICVIGPLLSKGIDQVTAHAQELGVPLVSLARYTGMPADYIFQAGLTLKLQASEMARNAIERLGMKRFAVVFPRDKVGKEISQDFWDAVDQLGGEVTAYEGYDPGETDFRQVIDKVTGLYYSDARQRELNVLARERATQKIKKRTRKTEKYFALTPVVDFDAVFIPDDPKVAGQVFPTFTYRDVDKTKFLGTSAWNSPEFVQRAGAYGESSLFLDAFFIPGPGPAQSAGTGPAAASAETPAVELSPLAQRFIEKYRATYNDDPIAMDALAFDAAQLVNQSLGGTDLSRVALRDRLKAIQGFRGVTGKISYKDGQFMRDLQILTVRAGQITALQ